MTHQEHFENLCKHFEGFESVCSSIIQECPETNKPVIAFKGYWWYMEMTDTGIPYPSRLGCNSLEKKPGGSKSVWNLLHLEGKYTERVTTDLQRAMFYTWGAGNTGEDDNWLEIDFFGDTNYPIQDLDADACQRLLQSVNSWLDGDGAGDLTLTWCQVDDRFKRCHCDFSKKFVTDVRSPICPFARVYSGQTFQWSSCHTAKMEGVMLDQIDEVFAECYVRGHSLDQHERGNEAKMWLSVMQTFLLKKIEEFSQ